MSPFNCGLITLFVLVGFLWPSATEGSECPARWFDCGNDKCIAALWRCDGEDDCGNQRDETNCYEQPSVTVHCPLRHFHCNDSELCLPDKWKCDGHHDCPDGGDEKLCATNTATCMGFSCKSQQCIPSRWQCDGVPDCEDGTDEKGCPVRSNKCTKSDGFFECDTGECIPHSQACDKHADCPRGEDEGQHCDLKSCAITNCTHSCYATPHGDACYCREGYQLAEDGISCIDIDECLEEGFCSHTCVNFAGGFKCSCSDGYKLVGNTSCVVSGPEPLMLFSDGDGIRGIYLRSGRYFPVHSAVKQVVGLDMNGEDSRIYWADVGTAHSGIYSCELDGTDFEPVVAAGLKDPEDVAVDWVGHNIYLTDSGIKKIVVCQKDGSICAVLFDDVDLPRALALDPPNGLLFYTDWGTRPGVYKAGMDGTERVPVVNNDLLWPNGLTFDSTTNRLYWSDAQLNRIEYFDLSTKHRQVLIQDTVFHPFSMTVFEDNLYWSDWITYSLDVCNKFTGRNQSMLLRENGRHMMGVHVYHPILHPHALNPCWSNQCSHLCLLGPRKTYTCSCPGHLVLDRDKLTCVSNTSTYLLVGVQKSVKKLYPETIGKDTVESLEISHNLVVEDFSYDFENNILYVFDLNKYIIASFNLTSHVSKTLISSHLSSVHGLTFDSFTKNLYWLDGNKGLLEVASVSSTARMTLLNNLERPIDLVLHPEKAQLYIANLGSEPHILVADMDGKNQRKLIATNLGLPVALFFCSAHNELFWADAKKGVIEVMELTEENIMNGRRRIIREHLGHVMSLAVSDNTVYWTDMDTGYVYHTPVYQKTEKPALVPLPGHHNGSSVKKIKIAQKVKTGGACSGNHGCSHLCLLTSTVGGSEASCHCPIGYKLQADRKTCIEEKDLCKEDEVMCSDGSHCILEVWKCDGNPDCDDSADEKNCTGICAEEDFKCENGKCILGIWHCDNMDDCGDDSDEVNCTARRGKCPEGHFDCGQGQCIPSIWRCDNQADCSNGHDEADCDVATCQEDSTQLKCKNGQCVPIQWECDGEADCSDSTDELDCHLKECIADEFRCKNNLCIDKTMVCDKSKDCSDGSDEDACLYKQDPCPHDLFTCESDGHCIYISDVCDGHNDCDRAEDESNCTEHHCGEHESSCSLTNSTTQCIPHVWVCDGENDCGDWSDETRPQCLLRKEEATTTTGRPCKDGSFPCSSGECVSYEQVCDKHADCLDSSDEGSQCTLSCEEDNGGCAHICRETPSGASCACTTGYVLSTDEKSCGDIDECVPGLHLCSHFCENTKGSFKCSCAPGYQLAADHLRCKAFYNASVEAWMFYMLPDRIHSFGLISHSVHLLTESDSVDMEGMDYDYKMGVVLWATGKEGAIKSQDTKSAVQRTIKRGLARPRHLSWDWIGRNYYFINGDGNITVCNENGAFCSCVLSTGLPHIKSLVVVPSSGLMFWSIWSSNMGTNAGLIERADMNGKKGKRIISSNIQWPSGLTADTVLKRLYWADTSLGQVGVCDFDGSRREKLLEYSLSHPYGLAIFEDNLYISNFGTDTLLKVSKFTGRSRLIMNRGGVKAEVIRVVHPVLQLRANNSCENRKCEHMCLLKSDGYSCHCGLGYSLYSDGLSCQIDAKDTIFDSDHDELMECDPELCHNGGECFVTASKPWCSCPPGYLGLHCEVEQMVDSRSMGSAFGWVATAFVILVLVVLTLIVINAVYKKPISRSTFSPLFKRPNLMKRLTDSIRSPTFGFKKEVPLLGGDDELDSNDMMINNGRRNSSFVNPAYGQAEDTEDDGTVTRWPSSDSLESCSTGLESRENSCSDLEGLTTHEKKDGVSFFFRKP